MAALNAAHGMDRAYEPKRRQMSFRVPAEWLARNGIKPRHWQAYERRRDAQIGKWLRMVDREGFDVCLDRDHHLTVGQGYYPAIDTLTGAALMGEGEIVVGGWFRCRKPKPLRIELPSALRVATVAGGHE